MPSTSDKVLALHEQLTTQIEALVTGDDWAAFLAVASRFHAYSPNNVLLILCSAPTPPWWRATAAGSASAARSTRGPRASPSSPPASTASAPSTRRKRPTSRAWPGCCGASPWSTSSTRPTPPVSRSPTCGPSSSTATPRSGTPWPPRSQPPATACPGATAHRPTATPGSPTTPWWWTRPGGRQADKTLCHELGHVLLHDASRIATDRDLAEIEAESVAYIVCNALGVETASYSLPYVANWARGDVDKVRATAERVVRTAQAVLAAMEARAAHDEALEESA